MNRPHATALLLTVFALVVVGAAAGTLPAAHDAGPSVDTPLGQPHATDGHGAPRSGDSTDNNAPGADLLPDISDTGTDTSETAAHTSLARLAVGVALLVVGVAVVLWRLTDDDGDLDADADDDTAPVNPAGERERAPARAASDAPVTNDVYRSWNAMVAELGETRQRSRTPADVARDALADGRPASAVRELTELFRSVRYGGATPTADRERRARRALERVQVRNARDEDGSSDDAMER
ncbi:DUF4129 domain-containing protein [Halarchaeum sp. P4]|uniref:DUF4129 domain-containing protein n=1 Tax=Halarchaeum sp. P4 TaxID=3421639 RepID=UPI003EBE82E8